MSDANRMREIDIIFHEALEHAGPERSKYLDEACRGDQDLRSQIESLLEADELPTLGLDRPQLEMFALDEAAAVARRPAALAEDTNREIKQIQCGRGHFYDPGKHHSCPYCGIGRSGAASHLSLPRSGHSKEGPPPVRVVDPPIRRPAVPDDSSTQWHDSSLESGSSQGSLIAGWLICVHGPDRGRDYRVRAQRNFIGRDPRMDICILGDPTISRKNHAVLTYDPRSNQFFIAPGDAHGVLYVNHEIVEVAVTLRPYDMIKLGPAGTTRLLFVPFCGEKFHW